MRATRTIKLLIGVGALTAIAAPSCVPVSAPSATGSFIACYKESGGAVRFVNSGETCDQGEKQATWNQTGPRGPQGVPGINGNGPAYHHHLESKLSTGLTPVTVGTLAPPAGSYAIDFTAMVLRYQNGAPNNLDSVSCSFGDSVGSLQGPALYSTAAGAVLAWHIVRTLPGGNIAMYCTAGGSASNTYEFWNVDFTATKITEIVEQ